MVGYKRDYDDQAVHAGACSLCGLPILYARTVGLLTVVEALPVPEAEEWRYVAAQRPTYSVHANRLKRRTREFRDWAADRLGLRADGPKTFTVHVEHDCTGKGRAPQPRQIRRPPKPKTADDEEPPFRKAWRCFVCREVIQPEEQGMSYHYSGPDYSIYMCRCEKNCEPKKRSGFNVGKSKWV